MRFHLRACPKRAETDPKYPAPQAQASKVAPKPRVAIRAKRPVKRTTLTALTLLAAKASEDAQNGRDLVNHPAHYNKGRIEVIDFIEDQGLGFCLGNVVKYITRQTESDDLKKAAWYLAREIARQERQAAA
jgi:hypothetical protein